MYGEVEFEQMEIPGNKQKELILEKKKKIKSF